MDTYQVYTIFQRNAIFEKKNRFGTIIKYTNIALYLKIVQTFGSQAIGSLDCVVGEVDR